MIDFTGCAVNVAGYDLQASTASISVSNSRRAIKQHGTQGSHSQAPEGRIQGSVSVTYNLTDADTGIRSLTGINVFDVRIGPFNCYSGVLSSYSMDIQPYSPVSCQIEIDFYGGYNQTGAMTGISGGSGFIHGGTTTVESDLLWNNDIISASYSMSQSIEPIYKLGEYIPYGYKRNDGSINVSLEGTGFGSILTSPCSGYTTGKISLTGLCSTFSGDIDFSGFVINPNLSVSEGSEVQGSIEIFDTF